MGAGASTVNGGTPQVIDDGTVSDTYGCANRISDGVVPGQYGTWVYGRGGWCPGLDVAPFRADVTADLDFSGGPNVIAYRASLYGQPPANAGSIWMSSYLVFTK